MVTETQLFESPDLTPLDFCLVALDEEGSLQNKSGYKRQTALSHFVCGYLHKET